MKPMLTAIKLFIYMIRGWGFKYNKYKRSHRRRNVPSVTLYDNELDKVYYSSYQEASDLAEFCTKKYKGDHVVMELHSSRDFLGYGVYICTVQRLLTNKGVENVRAAY